MPFDLPRSIKTLPARHGDAFGFRFALLDLLFAVGCGAREQAVALQWGDALCLRTAGPPAPVAGKALVLLVVDLDLPGLHPTDPGGQWPAQLAGLGGPAAATVWLTALHALLSSGSQRPWELVYVRGPAAGTAEFVEGLCGEYADAEVVLLTPAGTERTADHDWVRLELTRPRNIWRFPTCDHTAAVHGTAPFGQAWPALRQLIATLGPAAAWTLHDLKIGAGQQAPFSATVRSSLPLAALGGLAVKPVVGEARLLFPVNDALSALGGLTDRLPAGLAAALAQPVAAHTLPDGLCVQALAPRLADTGELPERAAALSAVWDIAPVVRPWTGKTRLLAIDAAAAGSALPAGLPQTATVWYLPDFSDSNDVSGVSRALATALG